MIHWDRIGRDMNMAFRVATIQFKRLALALTPEGDEHGK